MKNFILKYFRNLLVNLIIFYICIPILSAQVYQFSKINSLNNTLKIDQVNNFPLKNDIMEDFADNQQSTRKINEKQSIFFNHIAFYYLM